VYLNLGEVIEGFIDWETKKIFWKS